MSQIYLYFVQWRYASKLQEQRPVPLILGGEHAMPIVVAVFEKKRRAERA